MPLKILVLRFSSIGDIVLTTPVLRCIKEQLPDCELHYATKKAYVSLLSANPYIDKIHAFEEKKLPALMDALDAEKFDFIADLHHNLRTFLITSHLGIPNRKFNKLNWQKWLMVKWKINKLPQQHIVDRYLKTVEPLGVKNDGKGLDHFIPADAHVAISSLPQEFQSGYIALVIGAMHATKKMPPVKLVELVDRCSLPVVLIGGPDDVAAADIIVQQATNKVFSACGKYPLQQSASLLQQSIKVYAHDTGMMHIAAALKKDVISIWGNTIPEFGMYPYFGTAYTIAQQRADGKILEVATLSCRPCSKLGYQSCPKGHFRCMLDIDLTGVK